MKHDFFYHAVIFLTSLIRSGKEGLKQRAQCEISHGKQSTLCLSISETKVVCVDQEGGLTAHIVLSEIIIDRWVETARFIPEDSFKLINDIEINDLLNSCEAISLDLLEGKNNVKSLVFTANDDCYLSYYVLGDCTRFCVLRDSSTSKDANIISIL